MPRVLPRLSRRAFIAGTPMISVAAAQVSSSTRRSEVNSLPSGSRVTSIEAKPDRVDVDLAKTAVIVVDMQNDFAAKGGLVNRLRFDIQPILATIPQQPRPPPCRSRQKCTRTERRGEPDSNS